MDQLLLVMEDEDGSTMKQAIYNQVVPEPCNVSAVGCRKAAVHHSLNRALHYADFVEALQANPRRPETLANYAIHKTLSLSFPFSFQQLLHKKTKALRVTHPEATTWHLQEDPQVLALYVSRQRQRQP